jgi:hypothetical protein
MLWFLAGKAMRKSGGDYTQLLKLYKNPSKLSQLLSVSQNKINSALSAALRETFFLRSRVSPRNENKKTLAQRRGERGEKHS